MSQKQLQTQTQQHVDEATMPRCVLAEGCKHPHLDVIAGHKCPICMGLVQVFCGVADPDDFVTCNTCIGPAKKKTKDKNEAPPKNKKKAPATKAKAPAKGKQLRKILRRMIRQTRLGLTSKKLQAPNP
jgi:hypothetical protein